MRRFSVATPLLIFALAAAAAPALAGKPRHAGVSPAGAPLPGYWRYATSFLFSDSTEMKCIAPADVDKVLQGPSNHHYDCSYPVREVAGGKARFQGVCTNKKNGQTATVALSGTYSPTRFDFRGVVKPDLGIMNLPISASITAERVADTCPAA